MISYETVRADVDEIFEKVVVQDARRVTSTKYRTSLVPSALEDKGWRASKGSWVGDYNLIIERISKEKPEYMGFGHNGSERKASLNRELFISVSNIALRLYKFRSTLSEVTGG